MTRTTKASERRATLVTVASAFALVMGVATSRAQSPPVVEFDHGKCTPPADPAGANCTVQVSGRAHAGDVILIHILNTYPEQFDYVIGYIPKPTPSDAVRAEESGPTNITLTQVHDAKYAGYVLRITPKKSVTNPLLGSATVSIKIETREWRQTFAGGFAASGLTDRAFAVRDSAVAAVPASDLSPAIPAHTRPTLIEEPERADRYTLGPTAFVHVSHTDHPWIGGSFGLRVDQSHGTTYYPGISLLAGDKAALTVGLAIGPRKTLPSGLTINDSVTSSSVLNSLSSRTDHSWFAAVSYAFAGNAQSTLGKPFLETPDGGATTSKGSGIRESEPPNAKASLVGNDTISATVGLPIVLTVMLTDENGKPLPNATVTWAAASPSPADAVTLGSVETETDQQGRSSTAVTLNRKTSVAIVATIHTHGAQKGNHHELTVPFVLTAP